VLPAPSPSRNTGNETAIKKETSQPINIRHKKSDEDNIFLICDYKNQHFNNV